MSSDTSRLIHAASRGDLQSVKQLVEECNADPNQQEDGENALEAAIKGDRFDIVRYFVEECFVDVPREVRDRHGNSGLSSELEQYLRITDYSNLRRTIIKEKNREIRALEQRVEELKHMVDNALPKHIHLRPTEQQYRKEKHEEFQEDKRHDI